MSERRLQAIYDALDVGNYKQVLKLCDVALKKGDGQIVEVHAPTCACSCGVPPRAAR